MISRAALALSFAVSFGSAHALAALDLALPAPARQTAGQELGVSSYALPIAPFDGASIPSREFEGFVSRQAWRIAGAGLTPLQVIQPLRATLSAQGYTTIFECSARECGGFDFRFGTDVISAPNMFVDLDDFRFISALQGPEDKPTAALSLLVSRSAGAAFVQIIQIAVDASARVTISSNGAAVSTPAPTRTEASGTARSIAQQLGLSGYAILGDLEFETGSSELGAGPFESLGQIATYLQQTPESQIALVGHTDAVGSLAGNVALSKRRAASVMDRLLTEFGISPDRLTADGVGFLSPIATNQTPAGREANRRVEAVLISVQ